MIYISYKRSKSPSSKRVYHVLELGRGHNDVLAHIDVFFRPLSSCGASSRIFLGGSLHDDLVVDLWHEVDLLYHGYHHLRLDDSLRRHVYALRWVGELNILNISALIVALSPEPLA